MYLNTGSKTQNVEELSLDMIFHNHCFNKEKKHCFKNEWILVTTQDILPQSGFYQVTDSADLLKISVK